MSENLRFSDVFRGYRNVILDYNELIPQFFVNFGQFPTDCLNH